MILLVETHAPRFSAKTPLSYVGYSAGDLTGNPAGGSGKKIIGPQFDGMVADQKIDLNSIVVTGYKKDDGSMDEVFAQELKVTGAGGKQYYWYDGFDWLGQEMYGWYDDDGKVEDGKVFLLPGDGLWVKAPSSKYVINIPGVKLD